MKNFKGIIAKVKSGEGSFGTAFLINSKYAMTAAHVIDEGDENDIELTFCNLPKRLTIKGVAIDLKYSIDNNIDAVIIQLADDAIFFTSEIPFIKSDLPETKQWYSYAFPSLKPQGEPLRGFINNTIFSEKDIKWDIDLICTNNLSNYKGASGAPLFINNRLVGIIIEESDNSITAISTTKLEPLLERNDNISIISEPITHSGLELKDIDTHLKAVRVAAKPRYTPELNIHTSVGQWFAAFGRTAEWMHSLEKRLNKARKKYKRLNEAIIRNSDDNFWPMWPDSLREEAINTSNDIANTLNSCEQLKENNDKGNYDSTVKQLERVLADLSLIEDQLTSDLDKQHGKGSADSPGFRQFMSEYQVSFPAANLDTTREAIDAIRKLYDWLTSPTGSLAFQRVLILSGKWGVGKTHGVCDVALQRLSRQLLSCVVFGHQFNGEPDPWTRLIESLGLPITIGKDGLLDALTDLAEASGQPFLLFIDAINETRPLQYWRNQMAGFVHEIKKRSNLRVCFTCRSSYLSQCLPDRHEYPVVEHPGFKGVEQVACAAFFRYYELSPPVAPILQPELANPLYLRLVCETLKSRGIDRIPTGWSSIAQVIAAFLEEKEKEFAREKGISEGARVVTQSLQNLAHTIAESGQSELTYSDANNALNKMRPDACVLQIVEWLISENLLIEETVNASGGIPAQSTVRLAFERLGDFLIASELLSQVNNIALQSAFMPEGKLHRFIRDRKAIEENYGFLSALSILISEQAHRWELPDLVASADVRDLLVEIAVDSIPTRDPKTLTLASQDLVREALSKPDLNKIAMENLLAVSWQKSAIDAYWLHKLLKQFPLAERDGYWCGYLHDSYEKSGTVKKLIDTAFDLPLNDLDLEVVERWAIALIWFTAASDRRVKDRATRSLIKIFSAQPAIIPNLLSQFIDVNDDEVRERLLLVSYGALIISPDDQVIGNITATLYKVFRNCPQNFNNALIRDHIRCIAELAELLNVLPENCDPQELMQPIPSDWPLELPSEEQMKKWKDTLRFKPDEFLSDFFKYSMNCLRPWMDSITKTDMGKWILQRIAWDFNYEGSKRNHYDQYMLGKYGGGRAKPVWAERIEKKYQWLAMYQLASRLHDHVERKEESWAPEPLRNPLILLEERKIDPTLVSRLISINRKKDVWWIGDTANLQIGEELSDSDWVKQKSDLPSMEKLLAIKEYKDQRWLLLVSYPSWDNRHEDDELNDQYRQVWIHIESYLVAENEADTAYDCLHRRNFFGDWMTKGASWLYGFAGEYPWASPFNIKRDEYHSTGGFGHDLPVIYTPTWNELAVEWEYDGSLEENFHMLIPARTFFSPSDLWWNGRDGYKIKNGKDVFRDFSISIPGPSALLVDVDDLLDRLKKLGLRLIWTILGEKWILGGLHNEPTPQRTFSQIARLEEDGSVHIGDRVFFSDYNKDTGPSKLE